MTQRKLHVKRAIPLAVLASTVVIAGVAWTFAATRPLTTAPGTTIGGLSADNLSRQGLRTLLVRTTARAPSELMVALGSRRTRLNAANLGLQVDVAATVDRTLADSGTSRRWGLLSRRNGHEVTPVLARDKTAFEATVARLRRTADVPESHGAFRFTSGKIRTSPPADGQTTDAARVTKALDSAATRVPWPAAVSVPVTRRPAHTTAADLQPLAASAQTLLSQPIVLRAGNRTATIAAASLGSMLTVTAHGNQPGHPVTLDLRPAAGSVLAAPAAKALSIARHEPKVAAPAAVPVLRAQSSVTWKPTPARTTLVTAGTAGQLVRPGAVLDALKRLLRNPAAARKQVVVTAKTQALRTSEAAARSINSVLGTFTTPFACCQPRVKNIALIARTVDGTLIGPGQSFSLNGIVGPRTKAKGYVQAPFILDGELSTDVGGGVSQFATTTFNAAFFAGARLDRHQAHSFYISRYPAGREATVNYPRIDLRWTNNTSSPVLVRAATTKTSLTVTLYGRDDGRTVQGVSGPRVPVPGKDFRIGVSRVVTLPGQPAQRDIFTTTYNTPPKGE